jgi:transcriptional regulator with XRE-family HTH domain
MDTKNEIREFLTSRRAKITPEQAGLRTYGSGARRVPGLRREEVALLAGVSVDYYTRLERGNAAGVSETVLEALSRALQLDDTERSHLFDLARATQTSSPRRRRRVQLIRPSVQHMLDAMAGVPAFVRNGRLDILGANELGRALYAGHFHSSAQPPNTARFVFLDRSAPTFYVEWERVANDVVAVLRAEAGRDPYDRELSDLIGELSTRSELFRTLWAAHNVRTHDTGRKRFHHPVVGELDLTFEAMDLVADPGLTMFVYTAEPGSKSEQALNLLASWTATPDQESTHADHEEQPRHHSGA